VRQAVRQVLGVKEGRWSVCVCVCEKSHMFNRECGLEVLCKMMWFTLNVDMTSQNNRYCWFSKDPHADQVIPLHHLKIRFWCAVSAHRIIGPVHFRDRMHF